MKIIDYKLIVLALALFVAPFVSQVWADSTTSREYQVKAAFLYNFMNFVDWPEEKSSDGNEPMIIGVIGKDPFGDAFEPVKNKKVKGKNVVIERFKGFEELEKSGEKDGSQPQPQIKTLKKCHVLFICSSERKRLGEIVDLIQDNNVLTVSDIEGFLEAGGIINFVMEDQKVRFEINVTTAKRAKLKIRSQLLRLAKRLVEEKPSDEAKS
jgi:hypothetical protein